MGKELSADCCAEALTGGIACINSNIKFELDNRDAEDWATVALAERMELAAKRTRSVSRLPFGLWECMRCASR